MLHKAKVISKVFVFLSVLILMASQMSVSVLARCEVAVDSQGNTYGDEECESESHLVANPPSGEVESDNMFDPEGSDYSDILDPDESDLDADDGNVYCCWHWFFRFCSFSCKVHSWPHQPFTMPELYANVSPVDDCIGDNCWPVQDFLTIALQDLEYTQPYIFGQSANSWDPVQALAAGLSCNETCFQDEIDSWSTNEVTINWNEPYAWTLAYLDETSEVAASGFLSDSVDMLDEPAINTLEDDDMEVYMATFVLQDDSIIPDWENWSESDMEQFLDDCSTDGSCWIEVTSVSTNEANDVPLAVSISNQAIQSHTMFRTILVLLLCGMSSMSVLVSRHRN